MVGRAGLGSSTIGNGLGLGWQKWTMGLGRAQTNVYSSGRAGTGLLVTFLGRAWTQLSGRCRALIYSIHWRHSWSSQWHFDLPRVKIRISHLSYITSSCMGIKHKPNFFQSGKWPNRELRPLVLLFHCLFKSSLSQHWIWFDVIIYIIIFNMTLY